MNKEYAQERQQRITEVRKQARINKKQFSKGQDGVKKHRTLKQQVRDVTRLLARVSSAATA